MADGMTVGELRKILFEFRNDQEVLVEYKGIGETALGIAAVRADAGGPTLVVEE